MFEQSLLEIAARGAPRKRWMLALSSLFQCALVGLLILIPMLSTQAVPRKLLPEVLLAPLPAPAGRAEERPAVKPVRAAQTEIHEGRVVAPNRIPEQIAILQEDSSPPAPPGGPDRWGVQGGIGHDAQGSSLWSNLIRPAPAAPPTPKPEAPQAPVTVGGDVQEGKAIYRPTPIYPPLARQARIQGTVVLEAIISRSGTIESLKLVQGHPMLVPAAMEAVRQWRYRPTLLNGEPVEVLTTITVHFMLSQ